MLNRSIPLILFFLFSMIENYHAQDNPLWMRYSAISPDGNTIVFSYKGDLYTVNSDGGEAELLTHHKAHDFRPVWSHDGEKIAYASYRYGNYDVFIVPSEGGAPERLSYHSSKDIPYSFTRDNENVLFSSPSRLDKASASGFPSGILSELYSVPDTGGRVEQVLTTPAEEAVYNEDESKMLYHDRKGFEDRWRKHHESSVTRDLWVWNKEKNKHTRLTKYRGEDRDPVWAGENKYFFLSERSGDFNVWKADMNDPQNPTQITNMKKHPVRFLTRSNGGMLCFSYHGEIYTMKENDESPSKVDIQINIDK
ncbi:MAG: peptidase S41, partial [Flavobacteriales bacterium]